MVPRLLCALVVYRCAAIAAVECGQGGCVLRSWSAGSSVVLPQKPPLARLLRRKLPACQNNLKRWSCAGSNDGAESSASAEASLVHHTSTPHTNNMVTTRAGTSTVHDERVGLTLPAWKVVLGTGTWQRSCICSPRLCATIATPRTVTRAWHVCDPHLILNPSYPVGYRRRAPSCLPRRFKRRHSHIHGAGASANRLSRASSDVSGQGELPPTMPL
jgi:hypothetical protein